MTGIPPLGDAITEGVAVTVILLTAQEVSVKISQQVVDADTISGVSAGDMIEFSIAISNTGTTTLSDVVVTSSLLDEQVERYTCCCG